MKHTKQKILEISLDLFSRKGFSAVSIRDICGQVQIKESTVYYHFRNKQAIFDELLEQFQNKASDMISRLEQALQNDFTPEGNPFYGNVCDTFFESYLMDDFCNKVMRLLSIEQLRSDTVREFYDDWMFRRPLQFQSKVFSVLAEKGVIPHGDCSYLAVKYYAPIYLFAQRWLFSGHLSQEQKDLFRKAAYDHIQNFFKEMGGGI